MFQIEKTPWEEFQETKTINPNWDCISKRDSREKKFNRSHAKRKRYKEMKFTPQPLDEDPVIDFQGLPFEIEKVTQAVLQPLPKEFLISGHGNRTRDSCGNFKAGYRNTDNPERVTTFLASCDQQGCPVCYNKFAKKTAQRKTKEIWEYKAFLKQPIHHVSIDFDLSITPGKKLMFKVVSLIKRLSINKNVGILLVEHPYRAKTECKFCGSLVSWDKPKCQNCNMEDFKQKVIWVFGWHYHLITNAWFSDLKYIEEFKKLNCIYNEISNIHNEEYLYNILAYELNHALYKPKHPCLHSFGFFRRSFYDYDESKSFEDIMEENGSKWRRVHHEIIEESSLKVKVKLSFNWWDHYNSKKDILEPVYLKTLCWYFKIKDFKNPLLSKRLILRFIYPLGTADGALDQYQ